MTKPKPAKPATPETPPPAPTEGSEPHPQDLDNANDTGEVPPAASEPMETDKSESGATA